jgi:signal transduction histidine kinase
LVEAVIYQLESLAAQGQVRLVNRVGYDLPEVYCDGQRIEQVLTNLISNALKFTPPQGTVTITAMAQDNFVSFRVTDTGCGIPPEAQAHIFDKFIQLHPNQDDRTKGTGLGLAIVKHLVELHGGAVGVESEVRKGSEFYFSLPVYQADLSRTMPH